MSRTAADKWADLSNLLARPDLQQPPTISLRFILGSLQDLGDVNDTFYTGEMTANEAVTVLERIIASALKGVAYDEMSYEDAQRYFDWYLDGGVR